MPIGIDMNNYDISMGTGQIRMSGGGGIAGNVYFNGNVGIGTNAPAYTLDVNGSFRSRGATDIAKSTANPNLYLEMNTSSTFKSALIDFHTGTTEVDWDSRIIADGGTGATGGGNINILATNTCFNNLVGIGTTTPGYSLDVSGSIRARRDIFFGADSAFQMERGTASKTLFIRHYSNPSANISFINDMPGGTTNVGIGTTTPTVELDVNGSARIMNNIQMGTSTNSYRRFTMGGGNSYGYLYGAYNQLGDGIHMGYNAYNDNTSWQINATGFGSGTSRISMGYGYIALYTAPEGSNPPTTLGLYQNSSGRIGIRTSGPGSNLHVSFSSSDNGMLHTSCVSNQTAAATALNNIYSASTIFGPSCTDSQLVFYSKTNNQSQLRFFLTGVAFFTGQHAVVMDKPEIQQNLDDYVGLIISSNDTGCTSYYNGVKYTGIDAIRINESLPNCKLSDTDNDKAVYGVITNQKNDEYFDDSGNPMYDNTDDGFDRQLFDRVRVNSVGEGSIWVTNINGNIENGDYITSSIIPGYGKKQNDDILHSYTVGKSIMSCDFSLTSTRYKTKTIEFNGETYIAAFIGCTYHCG